MSSHPYYQRFYAVIATIPVGTVASYSQVAQAAGQPRGARIVGWALGALPEQSTIPWWRVINAKRQLSIRNPKVGPEDQRALLEREGRQVKQLAEMFVVEGSDWAALSPLPPVEHD